MTKKLSPLWVKGPSGRVLHRKREYTKGGGRTLCGIHVGKGWQTSNLLNILKTVGRKCKRCAA